MEKYKTIKENSLIINPNTLVCKNGKQCFCDGSCKKPPQDLSNEQIIPEDLYKSKPLLLENSITLFPKVETKTSIIAEFKNKILELDKYRNEWGYIVENKDGDFVKLEDVLNLF